MFIGKLASIVWNKIKVGHMARSMSVGNGVIEIELNDKYDAINTDLFSNALIDQMYNGTDINIRTGTGVILKGLKIKGADGQVIKFENVLVKGMSLTGQIIPQIVEEKEEDIDIDLAKQLELETRPDDYRLDKQMNNPYNQCGFVLSGAIGPGQIRAWGIQGYLISGVYFPVRS